MSDAETKRDFHRHYYDSSVWQNTRWLGVRALKCPLDLWLYQEIIVEKRPDLILETGTFEGGSALFMAGVCELLGHGRVITIDASERRCGLSHPRIECLSGDSADPGILERIRDALQPDEKVMAVLDSDHRREHVFTEMELFAQLVTEGQYLVVEDTNINGHPVAEHHGPGPKEAVEAFLRTHDEFVADVSREKFFLTFNPGGYLLKTATRGNGSIPRSGVAAASSPSAASRATLPDLIWTGSRASSIIVTTYGTDTLYTQACLEAIRRWKRPHHELIVVSHDESPLLRAYLDACRAEGLVDRLVLAVSGHGHTRGFNLGLRFASSDVVFHIANDLVIGPSLVDDCAQKLRSSPELGLIGWHWHNDGTFWRNGRLVGHRVRDDQRPNMSATDEGNIRAAPWFTGRAFESLGGPLWICLCNTGFFGARREVLDRVGGGFAPTYKHYWADDFLSYAVLDQGLDISHFEAKFRQKGYFHEFQYDQLDVPGRRRHEDAVRHEGAFLDSIRLLGGGMTERESVFLHLLAKAIPDGAAVTNVGVWRGSSAIVLLDALRDKRIVFHFIDCFDLPGISAMSAQPPVAREEFLRYIQPYVMPNHGVCIERGNTLDMRCFPRSDFIFVDGGHTAECIAHDASLARECLNERGVAVFHDYGWPTWPDVKPAVDACFAAVEVFETVAVHREEPGRREAYTWPERARAVS